MEGVIRLGLLVGYIWLIGNLRDVKRVFAYHGAEHMTIHAYEHGRPLEPEEIERFPTAHPRCGTAFLLTVVLVSVVVFTMVGRPALVWAVASRIALLPVIAAVSYEFLRFSGAHSDRAWAQLLAVPRPDAAEADDAPAGPLADRGGGGGDDQHAGRRRGHRGEGARSRRAVGGR